MPRVRRHPVEPVPASPASGERVVRKPRRTADTIEDLERRALLRANDLSLLRALADHYEHRRAPDGDEDKWATEEEAFAGMLRRMDDGELDTLSRNQREWARDVAERRGVDWEPVQVRVGTSAVQARPRYVSHHRFGRGLVVEEREGKVTVAFEAEGVGTKTLLAGYLKDAACPAA